MKILKVTILFLLAALIGCSDSGDAPTAPTGGSSPILSVNNSSGTEGDAVIFTVSLNTAASSDVIFQYATSTGTATASDFVAVSGTDTIQAGNLSKTIQVILTDDVVVDKDETFTLTISNIQNAALGVSVGTATIIDDEISFMLDIRPIIQNNSCLNCHGGSNTSGGMNMGTATYTNLVNASGNNGDIITPGNASASNFYLKTTSTPPFGSQMPLGMTPLSAADQLKLRDWINQGAQDN